MPNKTLLAIAVVLAPVFVSADDEAAMTAEVYAIAKASKNEALLEHLSDPAHYKAMANLRAADTSAPRENLRIDDVVVDHTDATHAVAQTRYREKHSGRAGFEEVHLELKSGKWQVTQPPASTKP